MKKITACLVTLLIVLLPTLNAFANELPPPKPPKVLKTTNSSMKISVNGNAKEAKLVVPKHIWQKIKAEIEGEDSLNAANRFNLSPMQTLMSGIFLSLAFVFAGVWFVRKKSKALIGIALFALFGFATTVSLANIPPPQITTLKSNILSDDAKNFGASGTIKIEVVESPDNSITLVLPEGPK